MAVIVNAMLTTIGVILGLLAGGVCLVGVALGVSWVMGLGERGREDEK